MTYCGKMGLLQTLIHTQQGMGRFDLPPSGSCGCKVSVAATETYCHVGALYVGVFCSSVRPDLVGIYGIYPTLCDNHLWIIFPSGDINSGTVSVHFA